MIAKTEKGRDELSVRSKALGARARQVLVLSNGLRTRSEMIGMMGSLSTELIDSLLKDGYITDASIPDISTTPVEVLSRTGTFFQNPDGTLEPLKRAVMPFEQTTAADSGYAKLAITQEQGTSQETLPPKKSGKRSLAATKMYTIDMLQLSRNADSSAMAVQVHTSDTPDELISHVLASLGLVSRASGPAYALKMALRLQTMIPEVYLPELLEQITAIQESRSYE